jgi:hypothetical protein
VVGQVLLAFSSTRCTLLTHQKPFDHISTYGLVMGELSATEGPRTEAGQVGQTCMQACGGKLDSVFSITGLA